MTPTELREAVAFKLDAMTGFDSQTIADSIIRLVVAECVKVCQALNKKYGGGAGDDYNYGKQMGAAFCADAIGELIPTAEHGEIPKERRET